MTRLVLILLLWLCAACAVAAGELQPFSSDGCSLFPDGTFSDRNKWCSCCLQHDVAYWQGGTAAQRQAADQALRACVQQKTGDDNLAETMYLGVRAGGHPVFPTWYRWGYGWSYGRGYKPLTPEEKQQVQQLLEAYQQQQPQGYCGDTNAP